MPARLTVPELETSEAQPDSLCPCQACREAEARFGIYTVQLEFLESLWEQNHERSRARRRARTLLRRYLNSDQLEDQKKTGCFNVRGSNGRLYRISSRGRLPSFVDDQGDGRNAWPMGLGAIGGDVALALALWLQAEAQWIEQIACWWPDAHGYGMPTDYSGGI